MRKMVKLVVLVLAVVAAVSLFVNVNNGNISLDFANSGSPEWISGDTTVDFANSGSPEWISGDTTVDFANSGSPEWISGDTQEEVTVLSFNGNIINILTIIHQNGFKNSGLPETIEMSQLSM